MFILEKPVKFTVRAVRAYVQQAALHMMEAARDVSMPNNVRLQHIDAAMDRLLHLRVQLETRTIIDRMRSP